MKQVDCNKYFFLLLGFSAWLLFGLNPVLHAIETEKQVSSILQSKASVSYKRSLKSYRIPELQLLDFQGNKVDLSKLVNSERPVLLNFIFTTCPSFCPILSATFGQIQGKLQEQNHIGRPLLISISIDPEHDTPERLSKYARKFKAGPDWIFLTGSYDSILKVQKLFNAYQGEKMNHQALTFIHKPGSSKWLRLEGFTSAKNLLKEYQQLVLDSNR